VELEGVLWPGDDGELPVPFGLWTHPSGGAGIPSVEKNVPVSSIEIVVVCPLPWLTARVPADVEAGAMGVAQKQSAPLRPGAPGFARPALEELGRKADRR